MENNQSNDAPKRESREKLARQVSLFAILGVTVLGITGIVVSSIKGYDFQRITYIFGIIFPLIGTWMGTVLAYYFSKDNFEAASRSVENLVSKVTTADKLKAIEADEAWIPVGQIKYLTAPAEPTTITIETILGAMNAHSASRLPILSESKQLIYILHRSTVEGYIAQRLMNDGISSEQVKSETIATMLAKGSESVKQAIEKGMGFIKADASLLEAKKIMNKEKVIQDVFATKTGKVTESVLGWITNSIIAEKARV